MAAPQAPVLDPAGKAGSQVKLEESVFGAEVKPHLVHETVRAELNAARSATPSRVFKGVRMAGRMGGKRVTQVGLKVHEIDPERNLLLVKGAVPGPKNGYVEVREDKGRGGA